MKLWSCLLALLVTQSAARAELIAFEILHREPFASGKSFGATGPYEKIIGIAKFAVDPKHPRNKIIVDLENATRNKDGKVEFLSDVCILAPEDASKGNGAIFYDVNNRGRKLALRFFNFAAGGNDLDSKNAEGDGFLMRRGYTVVWCGWIGELLSGDHRLLMKAPIATDNGKPIRGVVRYEMVSEKAVGSMPLSRRDGHGSYSPTKRGASSGVLTWRMRENDPRVVIPRAQWKLQRLPVAKVKGGVGGTLGQIRLKLSGGFRPGYIYELVCEAEGPIVQGCGFAAVRDLISFLRHDTTKKNPIRRDDGKPSLTRAHAFGVSQSGRFLRHLLHQGFNVDEEERVVFNGLIPHVAGGGLGFFNHRFAQPTRHNGQHEAHLYPADVFPFTYGRSTDPYSKRTSSILGGYKKDQQPKVMHTQSAAEYWHRAGSLVHTDPLGKKDAEIPDNVRIYAFGGTQHGPASFPPSRGMADNLANPGDYRPFLRALLDALDEWVTKGEAPPPSVYPTISDKTLVDWSQESTGFPALPGVRYPQVIQAPVKLDLGPKFASSGIISIEPPKVLGKYVVLVPRCDEDGNNLGTLLPPEVAVPIATYTGWNLRRREVGAEGMLASLMGSYLEFAKTKVDRLSSGDPRKSLEERYAGYDDYDKRFRQACQKLIRSRYLLPEDAQGRYNIHLSHVKKVLK